MNIVTITSLYPNKNDPKLGIFIETRLRHLLKDYPEINLRVIAPVPWFPFSWKGFGEYAKYANVPDYEEIKGIEVYHPKYIVIPKIGMYLTPKLMVNPIKSCLKRLLKKQVVDVIDGHYFYPDGVAIEQVATEFNIPFTCTARGTDINLIPQYPKAKKMIQKVFKSADHLMAVCQALSDEMIQLGADKNKVTTLRNGVDLELFSASSNEEQQKLKTDFGINNKLILSVGWLIERKGHYLIIEALKQIPNATLYIAGNGPDEQKLKTLVKELNLTDRVTFLGSLRQPELNRYFKAADITVLASSREGWANVLLESMASGTPVVATKVWGTPEVVQNNMVGNLIERTIDDIAKGINQMLKQNTDRRLIREYAEQFDWKTTSKGQISIFKELKR